MAILQCNKSVLRLLPIIFLFMMNTSLAGPNRHTATKGTYLYILDYKNEKDSFPKFYVEELNESKLKKTNRYWITFVRDNPIVEIYDNSWFDRFLKPTGDFNKAHVARVVRNTIVTVDQRHYQKIKDRPHLYTYYPNNEMVPRTNMKVKLVANDFNQCTPSPKPPLRKNGQPCNERGNAYKLPQFLWNEIIAVLTENSEIHHYYKNGIITPPMIAAAAHLETQFDPALENAAEKEQCLKGQCTPYKWGKGVGQMGDSESNKLWNVDWEAPKKHKSRFVRNFEKISRRLLKNCGGHPRLSRRCISKFKKHIKNCTRYEKENSGTSHAFCFKPAFRMFAKKMLFAFTKKSTVWEEYTKGKNLHIRPKKISHIINEVAQDNKDLWFAMSARLRAGYINRGAMVTLSMQECINSQQDIPCSYGNLNNKVSRRPASASTLGTPPKYLGAQILKGEFINRCHVWHFAGLCGTVRKNSLLDQYSTLYSKKIGPLPKANPQAL